MSNNYIVLKDGKNVPFSSVVADCASNLCFPIAKGDDLNKVLRNMCTYINNNSGGGTASFYALPPLYYNEISHELSLDFAAFDDRYVVNTRTVTTSGPGIIGGGPLSVDQDISLDFTYFDGNYIKQGGNSFGSYMQIGTNDDWGVLIRTNGINGWEFSSTGYLRHITDTWSIDIDGTAQFGALSVQYLPPYVSTDSPMFAVKSSNTIVDGNQIFSMTAAEVLIAIGAAPSSGSNAYIQNQITQQLSSNFNISGVGVIGERLSFNSPNGSFVISDEPSATGGNYNIVFGSGAGFGVLKDNNIFIGNFSGSGPYTLGFGGNVALGDSTLASMTGNSLTDNNTAIGSYAGALLTTGAGNAMFGANAGESILTGSHNLLLEGGSYSNGPSYGDISSNIILAAGNPRAVYAQWDSSKNLTTKGSLTITTIAARATAATVFLTHTAGLVQTRTAAQVLSDIGAVSLTGSYADPSWITSLSWSKIIVSSGDLIATLGYTPEDVANKSIATGLGTSNVLYPTQLAVKTYVDAAVSGSFILQGDWNASTNTPNLSGSITTGFAWRVSVAGSTNLGGITDWQVNDIAVKTATGWIKFDNSNTVLSVNGYTGAVVLTTTEIAEGTNLYYTNGRGIGSLLTGYTSGAGTISSSDSILTAIEKLNGNIGAIGTGYVPYVGATTNVNLGAYTITTNALIKAGGTNLDVLLADGTTTDYASIVSGGQLVIFNWRYDSTTASANPGSGKFRANNISAPSVNNLYISDLTSDTGLDISALFAKVNGNWLIQIQQENDATKFVQFTTTGAYTDNTGWWTIPVTFVQAGPGGSLTNNAKCTFIFVNQNDINSTRTLTINGLTQDLSADRTYTITTTGTANRITVTGGATLTPTVDIASTYVGQTSITTLGTITTGVWQGTPIANAFLANSTISGISLGSNLNAVTFNNGGAGDASGITYNGSTARTISYNTIGAAPSSGSTAYIQNQFVSAQTVAEAWISGRFRADGVAAFGGAVTSNHLEVYGTVSLQRINFQATYGEINTVNQPLTLKRASGTDNAVIVFQEMGNTAASRITAVTGGGLAIASGTGANVWVNINSTGTTFGSSATPTHTITLPSVANGIVVYNTSDQTTNYERVRELWSSNVYTILSERGGTGTARAIQINAGGRILNITNASSSIGIINVDGGNTSGNGSTFGTTAQYVSNNGIQVMNTIAANINQSATGGYIALKITPWENTTGSGTKYLIDAGLNTAADGSGTHTSKFSVDNIGNAALAGGIISLGTSFSLGGALQANFNGAIRGALYFNAGTFGSTVSPYTYLVTQNQSTTGSSLVGFHHTITYNQTGTSLTNTDFYLNRVETSLGTTPGSQNLMKLAVGGVDKFYVDKFGNTTMGALTASIVALGTTATTFLTHTAGLVQSRTAAQVAADLPTTGTTSYIQNQFVSAQTTAEAWLSGRFRAEGGIGIGATPIAGTDGLVIAGINAGSGNYSIKIARTTGTTIAGILMLKAPVFQIVGGDTENAPASAGFISTQIGVYGNKEIGAAHINLAGTRSTAAQLYAGTYTAVANGDSLGAIHFSGDDGTNVRTSAGGIMAYVDTTQQAISTGVIPTELRIRSGFRAPVTIHLNSTEYARFNYTSAGAFGFGLNTIAPTHTLTLGSTSNGFVSYNTVDQTTNYERVRQYWSGNTYYIVGEALGTGAGRALRIGHTSTIRYIDFGINNREIVFFNSTAGSNGPGLFNFDGAISNSTGNVANVSINSTVNQSSTAGYTAFRVSIFEQATGSGVKYLMDLGTNSAAAAGGTHTSKVIVTNDGSVGIGTTTLIGRSLRVGKNITGATSGYGILNDGNIQSDVTLVAYYNNTTASTAVASFTLSELYHYRAAQGTFGAGSTVNIQYGFAVDSTMIGAGTANYGFWGNIASGTGRWNLYMGGTASNYMAGKLLFSSALTSTASPNIQNWSTSASAGALLLKNTTYDSNTAGTNGFALSQGTTGNLTLGYYGVSDDIVITPGHLVGILTAPTHTLTLASTSTGFVQYNTTDQTTNYERLRQAWSSNIFNIISEKGGTGVERNINIQVGSAAFVISNGLTLGGYYTFSKSSATGDASMVSVTGTQTQASGFVNAFAAIPTINQSGTAGYRGFWASIYEQATGSGSKLLMDLGLNSAALGAGTHTSKFTVDKNGNVVAIGTITQSVTTGMLKAVAGVITAATAGTDYLATVAHTHTISNSAGASQFTFAESQDIRFAGAGDTTVSFNAGTRTITITSVPGSGGGGAVTTFNGRTGGVISVDGDYTLDLLGDVVLTSVTNGDLLRYDSGTTKWVNIANPYIEASRFIVDEIPSGTINGSNNVFTLAHTPTTGKLMVFVNGVKMEVGGASDYTISAATITFNAGAVPQTGDKLSATYFY